MAEGTDNISFDEFCAKYKIRDKTKQTLIDECYDDVELLKETSQEKLEMLNIKKGQIDCILKGVKDLLKGTTPDKNRKCNGQDVEENKIIDFPRLSSRLQSYAAKLEHGEHSPETELWGDHFQIHNCPLGNVFHNPEQKIRKYMAGDPFKDHVRTKTIFLVGASGSGKSTLINGMANYFFGVKWTEKERVKLIRLSENENENFKKGQAVSQTEYITVYTIPYTSETQVKYTLNIVDTPGFADTEGLAKDEELKLRISHFFKHTKEHGIDFVNAVCFVAKSTDTRLTALQKYIFDAILSMFGNNLADNIFVMATFADAGEPPLLETLKAEKVEYTKYYKFNNSALFKSSSEGQTNAELNLNAVYWEICMDNFKQFFDDLFITPEKSVTLTAEVLEQRECLSYTLERMQKNIQHGCLKLNQINNERATLEKHRNEVEDNRDYDYEVEELHTVEIKVPIGHYTTNCKHCHTTCHQRCKIYKDEKKRKCVAIDEDGNCRNCPGHCKWDMHSNEGHVYEMVSEKIRRSYGEMKERYKVASDNFENQALLIGDLEEQSREEEKQLEENITTARECLNKLREIALKPYPLTDVGYIDMLIAQETRELKSGWENRVRVLQEYKKKLELTATLK